MTSVLLPSTFWPALGDVIVSVGGVLSNVAVFVFEKPVFGTESSWVAWNVYAPCGGVVIEVDHAPATTGIPEIVWYVTPPGLVLTTTVTVVASPTAVPAVPLIGTVPAFENDPSGGLMSVTVGAT